MVGKGELNTGSNKGNKNVACECEAKVRAFLRTIKGKEGFAGNLRHETNCGGKYRRLTLRYFFCLKFSALQKYLEKNWFNPNVPAYLLSSIPDQKYVSSPSLLLPENHRYLPASCPQFSDGNQAHK